MSEKYDIPEKNSLDSMEGITLEQEKNKFLDLFNKDFSIRDLPADTAIFEMFENQRVGNIRDMDKFIDEISNIYDFIDLYEAGLFDDYKTRNFAESKTVESLENILPNLNQDRKKELLTITAKELYETLSPWSHPYHVFNLINGGPLFKFSEPIFDGLKNDVRFELSPQNYFEYTIFLAVGNLPRLYKTYLSSRNVPMEQIKDDVQKEKIEKILNEMFHESIRFCQIYLGCVSKLLILFARDKNLSFDDLVDNTHSSDYDNAKKILDEFSRDPYDSILGLFNFKIAEIGQSNLDYLLKCLKEFNNLLELLDKQLEDKI
jgi:hypothetical protein